MNKERKTGRMDDMKIYQSAYVLELARGSSYIASTLTPATLRAAIVEACREFREQYGADKVHIFRELLARSLEKRDNRKAAAVVRSFDLL
ncbi:hypothetical protein [Paraburkholderia lacunae]|uniref:hypothetical protein n=1 Tax=Paraburkholderia lacunae TaxID=2211104 RepID=UPI001403495F|nr:hypothetical protein [Paraburkholderia lacunae]